MEVPSGWLWGVAHHVLCNCWTLLPPLPPFLPQMAETSVVHTVLKLIAAGQGNWLPKNKGEWGWAGRDWSLPCTMHRYCLCAGMLACEAVFLTRSLPHADRS